MFTFLLHRIFQQYATLLLLDNYFKKDVKSLGNKHFIDQICSNGSGQLKEPPKEVST